MNPLMPFIQGLKAFLPKLGMEAIFGTIILLVIVLISGIFINRVENFDSWSITGDKFTFNKCCNEEQIAYCEKFGKTGICKYDAKKYGPNECVCEAAF